MADIKSIILNTPAEELQDIISPFIEGQFPNFMQSDYRKLVLFVKAYYEWMEQQGNAAFVTSKFSSAIDVDNNLEEFYSHFAATYLDGFPSKLATSVDGNTANKKTLLKKIKNFYGTKGTESAYRFLFRVLYDSDVQFKYPKNDIFKPSNGVWVEERSIKITRANETKHSSAVGGTVTQDINGVLQASANIENVFMYYQDGTPITELYLRDIIGVFAPNTSTTINPPSASGVLAFSEKTFSVLGEFFIETEGENYSIGDVVYVTTGEGGVGFAASVEQTGLAGSVKKIKIKNSGINYFTSVNAVVITPNGINNNAIILLNPSAVTNYPGYYEGNSGKLSYTDKIYDGEYYQEYSYHLKSAVSLDKYYAVLRKLVHPAGMKMFGSILLESTISASANGSTQVTRQGIPVVGNYTPYTNGTTLDLRANGNTLGGAGWRHQMGGVTYGTTGDLYPLGYNPYIGGTADKGPDGITVSPAGTTFNAGGSGGKLGYTYCSVPESGRTAHNPLGGALGGITAWRLGNEFRLPPTVVGGSPFSVTGLTLWLKPENIGVCGGSLVTGRSMDIWRDASTSQNHALPPVWGAWTTSTPGVTIDKLRPTLVVNHSGIAGRTGIAFNGGVLYGPHTVWSQAGVCGGYPTGKTLGALQTTTVPWGTGTTGEKILTGQHFRLTRGITLTADMSVFIVMQAGATTGYTASNYGLGLVSSAKLFYNFSPAVGVGLTFGGAETDHLFYNRSYSDIDSDITKQNSTYYFVNSGTNESFYPYESGLVGFRNNTGSTANSRIAYSPNTNTVVGVSLENITLGEWSRATDGRIRSFYSGTESQNYTASNARRIARTDSPGGSSLLNLAASEVSYNTADLSVGRFGAYCLPVLDAPYSDSVGSSPSFITSATQNVSYSFRGVIYEVLIYTRILNATERQMVYAYLSQKYRLDGVIPDTFTASHPSAEPFYGTGTSAYKQFWDIAKHPNTAGSKAILPGVSFGTVSIAYLNSLYGLLYKSAGTRLGDGTVLNADTYTQLGE